MIIKEITAGALKDFINSPEYKKMKVAPITRHRALSHIKNPRVSQEDVVLLLAYIENELVGYLGVLADRFFLNDREQKMGWISCVWTDSGTQGKGVVKTLLNQAFKLWDNKILVTQFTPEARGTYLRSGLFMPPLAYIGIRGYLRFNLSELLPPKNKYFRKFILVLKISDAVLNIFNAIRIVVFKLFFKASKSKIEYINEPDKETELLIKNSQENNFTKRQASDLDWIIKNPWILSAPSKDCTSERYYFSSLEKQYITLNIKLYDSNDNVKAFLMMSVRGKNLKIPYCYFHPGDIEEVVNLIYKHMLGMNLNMVTAFNPLLRDYMLNHKTPFFYKRKIKQEYFISKTLENELENTSSIKFQDGDGDCAFT